MFLGLLIVEILFIKARHKRRFFRGSFVKVRRKRWPFRGISCESSPQAPILGVFFVKIRHKADTVGVIMGDQEVCPAMTLLAVLVNAIKV